MGFQVPRVKLSVSNLVIQRLSLSDAPAYKVKSPPIRRSPLAATATNTLDDSGGSTVCMSVSADGVCNDRIQLIVDLGASTPLNCPFSSSVKALHKPLVETTDTKYIRLLAREFIIRPLSPLRVYINEIYRSTIVPSSKRTKVVETTSEPAVPLATAIARLVFGFL
jgi:hypothetical protein